MSIFAQRLESVMKEKQIRQHELCKMTGISKSFISSYLAGRFSPKPDKLSAISKALGVSEGWLMGYENSVRDCYTTENVAKIAVAQVVADTAIVYSTPQFHQTSGQCRHLTTLLPEQVKHKAKGGLLPYAWQP